MTTAETHEHGKRRDRALLSSASATIVARLVTALSAVVTVAIAARALDRAELGVFAVLTTLVVYLGFGDLGLGTLLMTRLPALSARDDHDGMRVLVAATVSALSLVAAVLGGLGIVSAVVLPWPGYLGAHAVGHVDVRLAVVCFFLFGALAIPGTIGSRILAGMQRGLLIRVWNSVIAVVSVIDVALCSALGMRMWVYVAAITAPPAVFGIAQLYWTLARSYPFLKPSRADLRLGKSLTILGSGTVYAVLSVGWILSYTLDSLIVSNLLGAASAAVFAIAARMFNLVGGTLSIAGQQMWPALAEALARGDVGWVRRRFQHSVWVAAGAAAAGCLLLVVVGRLIARFWVGSGLVPPLSLLFAFAAWTIVFTAVTQYSYLLTAAEQVRVLAVITLAMAVANIGLSIALTKLLGLSGPVLGSLAATLLVQVWPLVRLSRKQLDKFSVLAPAARHGQIPES